MVKTALAAALFSVSGNGHAIMAHDWMPADTRWCCNDKDCIAQPRESIARLPDGWMLKQNGQIFHDGDRGVYQNFAPHLGAVWVCWPQYEPRARCIFVDPEGS